MSGSKYFDIIVKIVCVSIFYHSYKIFINIMDNERHINSINQSISINGNTYFYLMLIDYILIEINVIVSWNSEAFRNSRCYFKTCSLQINFWKSQKSIRHSRFTYLPDQPKHAAFHWTFFQLGPFFFKTYHTEKLYIWV